MESKNISAFLTEKPKGFLITGIGASAGGIQALQEFFQHVPENSHVAYVVILHLSPDHDSKLAEVLQAVTTIPVTQVKEKVKIEPDHIYVVPPNQHLIMEDGFVAPSLNLQMEERRAPVDIFFRSLANTHGPRAICVVLSGTGANGSMGMKRIKEMGGVAYVQNPREAEFNEMPRNSIATELVDEVLPVAEIPARIIAYRDSLGTVEIVVEAEKRPEQQQQALREIFTQLRLRTGHDFSNYKRPTLLRRIERRINIHNLPDLPSYVAFVHQNIDEVNALLKDLLISVTNFFRDRKPFLSLEQEILPVVFRDKKSEEEVRIWVAGCATGEEAYSLAMLVAEITQGLIDAPKVQIFATDIDEAALSAAREGLYTLNDAADVSTDRLRNFFYKEGDHYRIKREIREMILFANHNFLKDPPFSRLDLVTCRNVLIYLNSTAQERVMETFHFALKPGGFLFLGSSESVDGASDLYATYSRENHIFQAREIGMRHYPVPESVPTTLQTRKLPAVKLTDTEPRPTNRISFGELHQKMLEQYAPPSLVVNEDYDIMHMSEKVGRFLEFSGGEPTKNLLKLIKPELRLELRSALYQSVQHKSPIEARNIQFGSNGERQSLNIHVRPVTKEGDTTKGFILIIFEPQQQVSPEESVIVTVNEPIARHLEEELIQVKAQLKNSGEQYEYQAEELKSSNEELQAMNEELRSAAEELETSKEELQSINEELRTVNQELKVKIEETSVTSNNLQNLINSADVATIFLDRFFSTRLYTPAALKIFNLIPSDYGRPISDITHRLEYHDLLHDAETVLEKLTVMEREVTTTDHQVYMMRVLPYRTTEDRISGVVITFFNITQSKHAAKALQQSEERLRLLIESAKDYAIFTLNLELQIVSWNSGAEAIFGYTEAEIIGKQSAITFVPADREKNIPEKEAETAQQEGRAENERWHLRKDGSRFWGSGLTQPLRDDQGNTIGFVKIMRDLTEQRQMEEAKFFLASIVETSNDSVITIDFRRNITSWNKAAEHLYGYSAEEVIGKNLTMLTLPEDFLAILNNVDAIEHSREVAVFDNVRHKKEGELLHLEIVMSPVLNISGDVIGISMVARDVSERKRREANLAFLAKINLDLAPLLSEHDVMGPVEEQLASYLQLSCCQFALVDGENDQMEVIYDYRQNEDIPSMMGVHRLSDYFTQEGRRHFGTGQPAIISAAADSPLLKTPAHELQLFGFGSRVDVPHLEGGQWQFLLTIGRTEVGEWRSDELEMLQELAAKIYIRVERARAEEALRQSEEKYRTLFESMDEGYILCEVIFDENEKAIDIRYLEANQAAVRMTGTELIGKTTRQLNLDYEQHWFDTFGRVAKTGNGEKHEYFAGPLGVWYSLYVFKVGAPNDTKVTAVYKDITERKRNEERQAFLLELSDVMRAQPNEEAIGVLCTSRLAGFLQAERCYVAALYPEEDKVYVGPEYRRADLHPASGEYRLSDFPEVVRKVQSETVVIWDVAGDPDLTEADKANLGAMALGAFVTAGVRKGNAKVIWTVIVASTQPRMWTPGEVAFLEDMAERTWTAVERAKTEEALRQSQHQLQQLNASLEHQVSERTQALGESRDMLQSVFDTTLLSLSILKAVRNETGTITDFLLVLVNKELERETGRTDLVGKLYTEEYPGIKKTGLFDLMLRVLETGEPGQVEYYYPHENFNRWYAAMFVKLDDGLVASNLDITDRKLAEAELTRNFTILKQAEEVAGMGSWEFDYTNNSFHWSEGMYHLFGLPVGSKKSPETYLDYVVEEDKPVAEKLVQTIKHNPQEVEETLRFQVNKKAITLQIKAIVMRDDLNRPYKMLGVDLDVSKFKSLEEENIRIRLDQQKALLLAILDAQQEERKRISESLHNGVGQLLYATKLNLDQLATQLPKNVVASTVKLLSDAIQETRRVSHELVPLILQDFGLTKAIHDLCHMYKTSAIGINCEVDLEGRLEPYLELAVYRVAQELLTNVVKHAQATDADLLLAQEEGIISLKVRDNGIGFNRPNGKTKGIGLRSIADRVKLLNGTFTHSSPPSGKGTLVVITIPVPDNSN